MKTIAGGCMMVRREMLDKIKGFDERFFMYAEDGDICRRIRSAGGKIYYLADESIMHGLGKSSGKAGEDFADLMKFESYHKLMGKYYGAWGQALFRSGLFFIGISKLAVAKILHALQKCSPEYKISRYNFMMKWALNQRKARIIQ
jgi:GT2 family glycosyltransferase